MCCIKESQHSPYSLVDFGLGSENGEAIAHGELEGDGCKPLKRGAARDEESVRKVVGEEEV